MTKASDNEYPSVLLDEQASAPTTPATGFWRVYAKSDGLYIVDDAGTETGPFGTGGGSGDMTLLDTQEVTSAATITFSSIPTTHKDLLITGSLRSAASVSFVEVRIQVGNTSVDTGTNYRYGGTLFSGTTVAEKVDTGVSSALIGYVPGDSNAAGIFWGANIKILDYADTTIARQVVGAGAGYEAAAGDRGISWNLGGHWVNTADAIDTVKLFVNNATDTFEVGAKLHLYGLG